MSNYARGRESTMTGYILLPTTFLKKHNDTERCTLKLRKISCALNISYRKAQLLLKELIKAGIITRKPTTIKDSK